MTMTERVRERDRDKADVAPPELADVTETEREITAFIREVVSDAAADGVVVNLSGGIDSTVAATLATEALGCESVYGLILPSEANRTANIDDARQVAEELVIEYRVLDIQPLLSQFVHTVTSETRELNRDPLRTATRVAVSPVKPRENYREAVGNAAARLRMMAAYFEANTTDRLVLGTGNRTELLLGYFTKYGDGGVDLLPLGDLYKTEVRALARHLGVRDEIIEKEPTAGLWAGQADESELGASYETIDTILQRLVDDGESIHDTAAAVSVDPDLVQTYAEMYDRTAHKRAMPPTPSGY